METPLWKLDESSDGVYEPREDSFLLLDSLEIDLYLIKEKCCPSVILEIGSGSGIIISALAKVLSSSVCFALDINPAACRITSETAHLNNVSIDILQSDLLRGLKMNGMIDLLVFNPPYLPSTEEEVICTLDKAWAGMDQGRHLINRLFSDLPDLMSDQCLGYLVAVEQNNPEEIVKELCTLGFNCMITAKRKIVGEKLCIIRFSKGVET